MKLLVDTDTGSDDAVALIMALRREQVVGITTVSGNVDLFQATSNALYTVELCGADVDVYPGAPRPLLSEPRYAHGFHGVDGLGDQGFVPSRAKPAAGHGVDMLVELARAHAGEITLVTLGPLTNVALALRIAPDLVDAIDRCVVMGGAACTVGNVTPAAEFNIWSDPEAAEVVFSSGLSIEMVGIEHCRGEAALSDAEMDQVRGIGTALADFALDCNATAIEAGRRLGYGGLTLPDPVAMAVALEPGVATVASKHHVAVETRGRLTRGMTVVDELGVTGREPNATVVWEIDTGAWKDLLYSSLR